MAHSYMQENLKDTTQKTKYLLEIIIQSSCKIKKSIHTKKVVFFPTSDLS